MLEEINIYEYIIFENITYYLEKIIWNIAYLYDEDNDLNKKIPLNEILEDLSFQWY